MSNYSTFYERSKHKPMTPRGIQEGFSEDKMLEPRLFLKINLLYYLFIYFWLCWVFVAAHGLSLVAVSRGCS